jgi:vacuolar-type H+-ATPase subunit I/STV1
MSELYRSVTMEYVRLLMHEDNSYEIIKQLGYFSLLHPVDLSELHSKHNAAPSDRSQNLKKRIGSCNYYEKKLTNYIELFNEYKLLTPENDEDFYNYRNQNKNSLTNQSTDILDSVERWLEPIDETLSTNMVFKQQQSNLIMQLTEQLYVLHYAGSNTIHKHTDNTSPAYGSTDETSSLLGRYSEEENNNENKQAEGNRYNHSMIACLFCV